MDYQARINDYNAQIGQAQGNYDTVNQQAGGAYNQFNTALGNAQNYGDIYSQARNQYMNTDEMNAARDASNNARNAVDQVNTTINKLPESIRQQYGGTGLTEAQRQRALSTQYQDMSNTYNMLNTNYGNARQDYSDLVNRAMAEVANVAGGNYQSQQDRLGALQSTWGTLLGQSNEAYNRILQNRGLLGDVYGQKQQSEQAEARLAFDRWAKQQDLQRAREAEQAQLGLQRYLANQAQAQADAQAKLQQQMLEKQNRARYNAYRTEQNNSINSQFQKDNSLWNNALNIFNSGYGDSIVNKASNARSGILSYDQFIGAK